MTSATPEEAPSTRWSRKKRLLAAIVGLLCLVSLVGFLSPSILWTGGVAVRLKVTVVDQNSERPIPKAAVRIVIPSGYKDMTQDQMDAELRRIGQSKTTDGVGQSVLVFGCGAGGTSDIFGKRGRFEINHELSVAANGYRPVAVSLATLLGKRKWSIHDREFDLTIRLLKEQQK